MQKPGILPLEADRWTAFVRQFRFQGLDLTNAKMAVEVRLLPDTPGDPLIALSTVSTANTQGIRLVGVAETGGVVTSTVYMRINETVMESLLPAPEIGDNIQLWWDMHITPVGGIKQRYLHGPFVVRSGVTQ